MTFPVLTPFCFDNHDLRMQLDDAGQRWFNANDVCAALELGNPRQALESHVDPEHVQKMNALDGRGRTQRVNHVNESGVYALIIGSTKGAANRLKRRVTREVFPLALTCIHANTGLWLEMLRNTLPAANEPLCSHNATQLAKITKSSAKDVNQALSLLGFQFRNEHDEWELSDAGKAWGEALPYSRNGHSGYQILWSPAVIQHQVWRLKATA